MALTIKLGRNSVASGTVFFSDQSQSHYYVAGDAVLQLAANTKEVMVTSLKSSEADPYSLRVASFPGTSWIAKEFYTGKEKKGDTEYLLFSHSEGVLAMRAIIRASDRYPVEVQIGELVYHFTEPSPYMEDVLLPEGFQATLAHHQAQITALDIMRQINAKRRAAQ